MQKKLEKERKAGKVAAPLLIVIALALIGGSVYLGQKIAHLEANGLRTTGEVVALESSKDSEGGYTYYPIVAFIPMDGTRIEFKDKVGSNPASHQRGETVDVLYLEAAPKESAMIDRGIWNWVVPVVLGLFGILCLYGSISSWRRAAETRPQVPVYDASPVKED